MWPGSQSLPELSNIWGSFSHGSKAVNPEACDTSSHSFFSAQPCIGKLAPIWHLLSQKHKDRGLSEYRFRRLSLKFWQGLEYCPQVPGSLTGISPTIKKTSPFTTSAAIAINYKSNWPLSTFCFARSGRNILLSPQSAPPGRACGDFTATGHFLFH